MHWGKIFIKIIVYLQRHPSEEGSTEPEVVRSVPATRAREVFRRQDTEATQTNDLIGYSLSGHLTGQKPNWLLQLVVLSFLFLKLEAFTGFGLALLKLGC